MAVTEQQLHDLLYQALETELGGVEVTRPRSAAPPTTTSARNGGSTTSRPPTTSSSSKGPWRPSDSIPAADTPGRRVVRHTGQALVKAIELARADGSPAQAQVLAAECVTLAETKDHLNWELIGEVVTHLTGEPAKVLRAAHKEVEDEEDEHLYHNTGWARELWIEGLGLPAALPPPEEQKDVKTAIGAARAKQQRREFA